MLRTERVEDAPEHRRSLLHRWSLPRCPIARRQPSSVRLRFDSGHSISEHDEHLERYACCGEAAARQRAKHEAVIAGFIGLDRCHRVGSWRCRRGGGRLGEKPERGKHGDCPDSARHSFQPLLRLQLLTTMTGVPRRACKAKCSSDSVPLLTRLVAETHNWFSPSEASLSAPPAFNTVLLLT